MVSNQVVLVVLSCAIVFAASTNVRLRPGSQYAGPRPVGAGVRVYSHNHEKIVESPEEVIEVVEEVPIKTKVVEDYSRDYSHVRAKAPSTTYTHTSSRLNDERIAEENHEQARSAHYSFATAVDDGINDHSHVRQEVRDGLKVTGSYSYSDGFFKRKVNYEADENGYRVVGEEIEPIGDGPLVDPAGKADVHTQISGVDTIYSITADDIRRVHPKEVKILKAKAAYDV